MTKVTNLFKSNLVVMDLIQINIHCNMKHFSFLCV